MLVREGLAQLAVSSSLAARPGSCAGFFNANTRLAREVHAASPNPRADHRVCPAERALAEQLCALELRAALAAGPWTPASRRQGEEAAELLLQQEEPAEAGSECGLGAAGCPLRVFDGFSSAGTLAIRLALEAAPASSRPVRTNTAEHARTPRRQPSGRPRTGPCRRCRR